jgi:general secretion pathway protein G
MKRRLFSLTTALITFAFGVISVTSFCAPTSDQPEISLEDPTPQINLSDEAVLRANLSQMRELIGRYNAGPRGSLHSLDDLVRAGYLKELPVDPMTGEKEWQPEGFGCPSMYGFYFFGITGVHSKSEAVSSIGTRYSEW